jgi:murein DD-endopeptidase MepM/ murein hydrolase activator NlpD
LRFSVIDQSALFLLLQPYRAAFTGILTLTDQLRPQPGQRSMAAVPAGVLMLLYPSQPRHQPQNEHRRAERRQSAGTVSRHLQRAHRAKDSYALVHGGRQVRIGPAGFWAIVAILAIMGTWTVATGAYFVFRGDVLSRLVSGDTRMQTAYEDRIAQLRAQVDRITSRRLLDHEQFENRLAALLKRQATLEHRTAALSENLLPTGPLDSPQSKEARLRGTAAPTTDGLPGTLDRVSHSLDHVEGRQTALLDGLEQHLEGKARRMRGVLDGLGLKPPVQAGVGGPFIPVKKPPAAASPFERQLYRVSLARARVKRYAHALKSVPVRQPLPGELEVNSGFGVRPDPFLHQPSMHTGLDLHGDMGEPVHATADGTVTIAGWDGGYGKLVEIDHGNGLSTRFGHLSKILVQVGQKVHIGEVIGRVGSTGRSTGPHLHYETRIDNQPVDPRRFLRAGTQLGSL